MNIFRRNFGCCAAVIGFCVSSAGAEPPQTPAAAQTPGKKPLLRSSFVGSDDGWVTLGAKARSALAAGGERRALRFDYVVEKGERALLMLPVEPTEIAGARSFRFAVRAEKTTTLALVLQEHEGGRWLAVFHAPGGKWQEVVLTTADFSLAEGKDDPKDPNGTLDVDLVETLGIADVSQLFVQSPDPALAALFGVTPGERSLLLGEFLVEGGAAGAAGAAPAATALDAFAGPQIGWLAVGGGTTLARSAAGKPLAEPGLRLTYPRAAGKLAGVLRPLTAPLRARLVRSGGVRVTLATERAGHVLVQLEEKGGGKYNALVTVPGGEEAKEVTLRFADFKPADDSKDANGRLDPEQVNNLLFLDITPMLEPDRGGVDNALWIGGLRADLPAGGV